MLGEPLQCFPSNVGEKRNSQKSSWFLGANQFHLRKDFALDDRNGVLESELCMRMLGQGLLLEKCF